MWGRKKGGAALIERDSALGSLDEVFSAARDGRGSLVLVEGSPGMGKSSLLSVAGISATEGYGLRVLRASGSEVQRSAAYGIVTDLLRPLFESQDRRVFTGAARLALPLFEPTEASSGSEATRFHGLFWTLSNLGDAQPVALFVDDCHWADITSLRFFNYIARQLEDLPVALVIAMRPGEPDMPFEEVARLRSQPLATGIPLTPLSAEGCISLLRRLGFRRIEPSAGRACAEITEGNPMLVTGLADLLDGTGPVTAERIRAVTDKMPSGSPGHLRLRGKLLDDDQIQVARAMAALGLGASVDRIGALTGLEHDSVAAAIDSLVGLDLVMVHPALGFSHPLIRASFYEDLDASERSALHARVAHLFVDEGRPASLAASHLLLTEPQGQRWVHETLYEAARTARTNGANDLAARYLARALQEPMDDDRRSEALIEAAVAEASASGERVSSYLEEATRLVGRTERLVVAYRDVGRHLYGDGRFAEAADVFEAAVELADDSTVLGAEVRGLYLSTARLDLQRRPKALEQIAAMAATGSFPDGPAGRMPRLEAALGHIRAADDHQLAVALLRQAIPHPSEALDELALTTVVPTLLHCMSWCDMLPEAEALAERSMNDARASGSVMLWANAGAFGALGMYMQGRIKEAEVLGRQALDALPFGWNVAVPFSSTITAYAAMERGDLDGAEAVLRLSEGRSWEGGTQWPFFLEARGRLRALKGDLDAAADDVSESGRLMVDVIGTNNPAMLGWRSRLARILHARGDHAKALDLVDEEIGWARRFGAPRSLATALRVRGQLTEEIEPLEEAFRLMEGSSAKMERAFTCLAYGKALTRLGHLKDARPLLLDAQMVGETIGAALLEAEARDALRKAGAKPRRQATTGVPALTPGELRVARLAARGYSNREIAESLFVTRKAIEWHLGNVYRKLGINSRKDLERALAPGSPPSIS